MTKSKHPISPGNEPFQVQPQSAVIRPTQPIILDNVSDQVFDGQKMTIMAADNQQTDTADHGDTLRLVKCSNVTIRNFTFNGNRDNRGGFAGSPVTIRLNGCTDIVIENCIFLNGVCADIFLWCYASPQDPNDHCTRVTIRNNVFRDPGRSSVEVIHGREIYIEDNDFADANTSDPWSAVDIEPNSGDAVGITGDITVSRNFVRRCGEGMAVRGRWTGVERVVFESNDIRDCRGDGLYCEAMGTTVAGTIGRSNGGFDVNVSNADACHILGNDCESIYADTGTYDTPVGHILRANIGKVNTQYARGNTVVS